MLACIASSVQAALTYDSAYYLKHKRQALSGSTKSDPIYKFINEVEAILENTTIDVGTTLTFDNGLTIDNVVNGVMEWNEASEELKWTFTTDAINLSSTSGVVSMDWGTIVPKADQFLCDPVVDPVGTVEGTIYYDSDDDNLYVRTTAGWTDLTAGASGVSDLDTAYDGGIAITVDAGAVALTATNAANNTVLALDQQDTATAKAVTLTNAGTGNSIDIQGQAGAKDIEGTDDSWNVSTAGLGTFSAVSATTGTFTTLYQSAIAAAAAGNIALTIDAAGNGTITIGGTSTGNTVLPGVVAMNGNVTVGNAATDTLGITSIINSNVTLDDGATDSPSLILKDATDETATFVKADGGNVTVTPGGASESFQVLTGNLKVGGGSEGVALNGQDAYVTGTFEVDGAVQLDGAVTLNGDVAINDQIAIAFGANDEEIVVTNTATDLTAGAIVSLVMAAQDNQAYILQLQQTPDADADNDFLLLEDNAGDDKFAINQGGSTVWTLDADSLVAIDGSTTLSTTTGGVLDIDMSSVTTGGDAVNIKVISTVGNGETSSAITIDLDDDTAAAGSIYGIDIAASDGTGSSVLYGLNIANSIETHIKSVLPAAGTWANIDAAATDNTTTTGVQLLAYDTITDGGKGIYIDFGVGDAGAGVTANALYIDQDDDTTSNASTINSIALVCSDTTGHATTLNRAIYTSGMDVALQADNGYVRIGTGSVADVPPGDDDLFVEGTIEVDAAARFDGAITANSTITGDGGDAFGGFLKTVTNDADGKTLTIAESGTVQTNSGAVGGGIWNLPEASTAIGMYFTFAVSATQNLDINPDAADQILGLTNAAGDAIRNATAGSTITLLAIDATNWVTVGTAYGTWSDVN